MFRSSKKDRTKSASSSVASHDQQVVAASSSVAESVSDNNTNNGNGTLVQLTMTDLQGLLQSHTNQLEYIFQSEMASLQSQLESIVEQKLESKLAQAEHNVKQFMKESIDDDDDDDDDKKSSNNNKELQDIKNQVASLEQSVSRIAGMAAANNQGVEVDQPNTTTIVNTNSSTMETSRVMECCTRLEQVVEERLQKMESLLVTTMNSANANNNKVDAAIPKPRPLQRSKSTDGVSFSPQGTMNGILATLRMHMDELITQRLNTMEQFIDSRHAELEAYVSSHGEKLHKDIVETLSNNSSGGGGGGITKEELEAILDARIQEEEDEDEVAQMSASHRRKSQQQQQPAAESSTQQNGPYSNTVVVQALERLIQVQQEWIAVQSSTQDLELKVQQKLDLLQQVDSNHGSIYPPSSTELYNKLVSKMESLEQLVLATLTTTTNTTTKISSSSRRKQRASSTTSGSGNNKKPMDNSSRVSNNNTNDNSSKRKSKRKPTVTTTATTATTTTNKGLAQIIDSNHTDNKNRGLPDDTSTLVARTGQTIVDITSVIATDAYLDVSVDGRRPDLDDDDDDDNDRAAAAATADDIISDSDNEADIDIDTKPPPADDDNANLVNKFMNTLSNWKELTEKQEDVKFIGAQNIDEKGVVEDDDDSDDDDDDEEDDDIDSNASMSVDSSVAGGGDDHAAMNRNTTKALLRLESKLDGLEDKVHRLLVASGHHHHHVMTDTTPNASMSALYNTAPVPSERSTNAKHSRDRPLSSVEEVQQMISVTHNALKHDLQQWLLDQQDESRYSQVRDGGMETSEDTQSAQPLSSSRQVSQSNQTNKNSSSFALTPEQLPGVTDKLQAIETIVTTLESFMQEQRRLAVPPVPQELPMLKNVLGQSHYELERKILRHLDTLDKSVQFKLDEIYAHLQQQGRRRLEEADLALLSPEDQSAIAEAIKTRMHEMQHAITTQLKESIPDYGNAKSVIGEALEEMRQIVSEVAISEVELLKTQLGVAEEAEQEALHAVVVLREMLEESKEQERRAHYAELTGLPTSTAVQPASGLFSFAPFAKLGLGGASVPAPQQRSGALPERFRTRQLSIGHQSHGSGLTPIPHPGSANASIWSTTNNLYTGTGVVNKHRSPQQKLEDWKSQVANLEDKSADLRSLYNQLRGQEAEDWLESSNQRTKLAPEGAGDVKAGLKISSRFATGETKLGEGGNEGELSSI